MSGTGATRLADGVVRDEPPPADEPQPPAARTGRAVIVGLLLGGWLLHVGWRLWLASRLYTPVVLGDESRYLIFARVLSGGPGGYGGDTEATRRAGYALLISPAYWFTSDPFTVHRLVQGLNAVINSATLPLAYLFARRVLDVDRRWAFGLAFVAASLPAVAFFAPFALPNAVLTPILLGWLLALHTWMTAVGDRARLYAATGAGAIMGLMYVVHVRALLLLGVHALVAVGLLVARRVGFTQVVASAAGALALMAVHPVLKRVLHGEVITGGTEPENRMLAAFTTIEGILRTGSDATGQIWYLCVGTWGLGAIGLVLGAYRLARPAGHAWPATVVIAACLASTVIIAVITSAALPADGKANNHIYPGYIIFLAPVWVMVGLAALRRARWRGVLAAGGGAAALSLVAWFVVESYSRPRGPIGKPRVFSSIDAPEPLFLVGDWEVVHLARVTAIVVGMIAVVTALMTWRRFLVPAVLVLLAATVVNVAAMQAVTRQMRVIADAQAGPELVRDGHVRPGSLVVSDERALTRFNHQREIYWRPLLMMDLSKQSPPTEAEFVVSMWYTGSPLHDWNGGQHGWVFVTGDPSFAWALWRRA